MPSVSALSACGRFMVRRPALPSRRINTSSVAGTCMGVPLTIAANSGLGIGSPQRNRRCRRFEDDSAPMTVWQRISGLATAVSDAGGGLLDGLAGVLGLNRPGREPQKEVAFTIAVIALSAKMAKADGIVSPLE